ncbi:unnamed protein product [Lactuca saligna]|uniref:Uncharacterized protein n=1 Tax=Lactuca saligna TaxID=75948 RepID=A0AA35YWE9_LACSI|nr:unnamed protein product [Lactuca saligna]
MIIEYEGKTICQYNENGDLPNVEGVGIGTQAYMANRAEAYNRVRRHNLRADLVEHVFNVRVNPNVDSFYEDELFDSTDDESEMFEGDSSDDYYDVVSDDD